MDVGAIGGIQRLLVEASGEDRLDGAVIRACVKQRAGTCGLQACGAKPLAQPQYALGRAQALQDAVGQQPFDELGTRRANFACLLQAPRAVVREQRPEAMDVIAKHAADVGATLLVEGHAFALNSRIPGVGGQAVAVRGIHGRYDGVFLRLHGEQAAHNAAAAITALEALLDRALDPRAVRRALDSVSSPGRVEVVQRHPTVILDGAHNPDAAAALTATLREAFDWRQLHLVIGMFVDKDVEAVARILAPLAGAAYACVNSSSHAASVDRVANALKNGGGPTAGTFDTVAEAVRAARDAAGAGDLILVTGSFYTVADARPLFVGA